MELRVSDGAHQVTVTGNIPDPAKNQPVTREDVEKRIRKTGDTAFVFDRLTVDLDDGLFVPNGVLNQLKRDALEQLQSEILKGYTRTSRKPDSGRGTGSADAAEGVGAISERHIVSTANRSLLPVMLSYDKVTDVYLDSTAYDRKNLAGQLLEDVFSCHQAKKLVYFILPSICREETMKFYRKLFKEPAMASLDGFVVKNLESLALVNEHFPDKKLICDHNLYAYNDDAVAAFLRAGADGVTVPLELNRKEIAGRYNGAGEMWVYGYYPLMTTAQCVCKNTEGCAHTPGVRYLVDRYRKRFAVQNCCAECYNIIYNSVPTMLFSYLGELKRYGITGYRLHFSVEAAEEAKRILQLYDAFLTGRKTALSESEKSLYTNGHYKRGVE
jgi:putative protease